MAPPHALERLSSLSSVLAAVGQYLLSCLSFLSAEVNLDPGNCNDCTSASLQNMGLGREVARSFIHSGTVCDRAVALPIERYDSLMSSFMLLQDTG